MVLLSVQAYPTLLCRGRYWCERCCRRWCRLRCGRYLGAGGEKPRDESGDDRSEFFPRYRRGIEVLVRDLVDTPMRCVRGSGRAC